MPTLASPAPKVEAATASAAPKEESVRYAAEIPPEVEPATANPAIPVKAPKAEPATNVDDEEENNALDVDNDDNQTHSSTSLHSLHASKLIKTSAYSGYVGVYAMSTKKKKYPWILRQALLLVNDDRIFLSYGEVKRFLIVHGNTCYVYLEETSQKPLYIINLRNYKSMLENDNNHLNPNCAIVSPDHHNTVTLNNVVLINVNGEDNDFQLVFENDNDVDSFLKNDYLCSK